MTLPSYGGVIGQTEVSSRANSFIAGQIASTNGNWYKVASFAALETIYPGYAVFTAANFVPTVQNPSGDFYVQLPYTSQGVITSPQAIADTDVTSIVLNGVTIPDITAVSTDPNTNLDQIAAAILAQANIASATPNYTTNSITVIATTGNPVVFGAVQTTTGTGSIFWTTASSTGGTFWGVSILDRTKTNVYAPQGVPGSISGSINPYYPNEPVLVMQFGQVAVAPELTTSAGVESPVTNGSPVYVRTVATTVNPNIGAFRSDDDGGNAVLIPNYCAQWVYGNAGLRGGVAVLNITCPQGG